MSEFFGVQLEAVAAAPIDDPSWKDVAGAAITAVGVPVLESERGPELADGTLEDIALLVAPVRPDPELSARQGFSGKPGQAMVVLRGEGAPAAVYLGCGRRDTLGVEDLRGAAAAFVRAAGRSGAAVMVLPRLLAEQAVGGDGALAHRRVAQALTEGAVLGAYQFTAHKSVSERGRVERFVVGGIGLDRGVLEAGVARGTRVAQAVCAARDLVNEPPSSMTPTQLAEATRELVGSVEGASAVTFEVWDERRIVEERLGGLLGVARGSAEVPRLIRVGYRPTHLPEDGRHVPHVVLVGKGITFDSGGLSLKSPEGMSRMKTDMSGAAAVLATVSACAALGVRSRVTAIVPATENMPGGSAIKPGDVLVVRDGQTIEVLNTDAEGRLVLADALSLAAELHPDAIVDLATLTGSAVVALGRSIAGLFGNDDVLVGKVIEAAARAGERVWQLPLAQEYTSHIESDVADMKNTGKADQAGSIAAALLLERFVHGVPWAHLDIAGPARSDEDHGLITKGGTGFGVRTLLELLDTYGSSSPD